MKKNRMTILVTLVSLAIAAGVYFSFNYRNSVETKRAETSDNYSKGEIYISADESFRPVIDEQLKVYQASYPGVKLHVQYKPEAECLKDLDKDSITLVIATRGLSEDERQYFTDTLKFAPPSGAMALDAIAVIVNSNSPDSTYTMDELRALLSGAGKPGKQVVFDGLSATSTVRYAMDSILRGKALGSNVKAAPSSQQVIDVVANNVNAVGFVGISWIGNPDDAAQQRYLEKVKISWIECTTCKGDTFVKPNQLSIATRQYPLVRGLYFIVKEKHFGLGSGIVSFMTHERGQLIFRRAYLVPTKIAFYVRNAKLNG
jgi:phosphate transport system substrate-binding protein